MKTLLSLCLLVALAAAYVVTSAASLPPTVAAHFGFGGTPDGYMSRDGYVTFMLVLIAVFPLFVALSARLLGRLSSAWFNLPHKDYWLAPERRAQTLAWIRSLMILYAHFLVVFLCFTHWIILEAHAASPVRLPEGPFFTGLAIFVVGTLLWAAVFHLHFRRRGSGAPR